MSKYQYYVESLYDGRWVRIHTASRDFCEGYLRRVLDDTHPRNEYRLMRSDGKVMESLYPIEEVSVGMIAGWPTPEQYEHAAQVALDKAARIREIQAKRPRSCLTN
jgi:hypothetical protein